MFEVERFVEECRAALSEDRPQKAIHELVAAAVTDPAAVMRAVGEPTKGEVKTLHRSSDLTVLSLAWAPGMDLMPHDHDMWAVIGIYTGQEDNTFWRRDGDGLRQMGLHQMGEKEVVSLGDSAIHSVRNPLTKVTAALHVYGGDFFDADRHEWDPETLEEKPYDVEKNLRLFEEANARMREPASA